MPYFDHAMARGVSEDPQRKSSVNLRTLPGGVSGGKNQVSEGADPALVEKYVHTLTQRKLLFMRSLLRAQVSFLHTSTYTETHTKKISLNNWRKHRGQSQPPTKSLKFSKSTKTNCCTRMDSKRFMMQRIARCHSLL